MALDLSIIGENWFEKKKNLTFHGKKTIIFVEKRMFIDTHCHLTDRQFEHDIKKVLTFSKECGVKAFITSGYDIASSEKAVEFALQHEGVYASVGVYPEYADLLDEKALLSLERMAQNEKVVAVGEIGLQFSQDCPAKDVQIKAFEKQIELAHYLKKPIVIHARDAMGAIIETLEKNRDKLTFGGTMHCFSGSKESAKRLLDLGLCISVGGVSTFKNAFNLKETLEYVPIEKIVLETDCPYLAPHPYRGQRNSPAFIPTIAENLAKIKNLTVDDVARITTNNAQKLFKLGEKDAAQI